MRDFSPNQLTFVKNIVKTVKITILILHGCVGALMLCYVGLSSCGQNKSELDIVSRSVYNKLEYRNLINLMIKCIVPRADSRLKLY